MKSRRDFLKLSGHYGTLAGLSTCLSPLAAWAEEAETLSGYKALVVVLQHGGNDSLNMLIPNGTDSKTGYKNYALMRDSLKVSNTDLTAKLSVTDSVLSLQSGAQNPYYADESLSDSYTKGLYKHSNINGLSTNAVMPEFAHLINQGHVAIVSNVGTLIQKTSKSEIKQGTATLPPYLYSHNSQRRLIFNGQASNLNRIAWAGRIADKWSASNGNSIYGMNISVQGITHMLYGANTEPLVLNPEEPTRYKLMNRNLYDILLERVVSTPYKKLYHDKVKHSFSMQDTIVDDWENASPSFSSKNAYGGELFSLPENSTLGIAGSDKVSDSLLTQLKAVAKLAYIGKNKGLKRQIFYVEQHGYDTHANQAQKHPSLLRPLSMALGDFQLALRDMGMENEVTTFNITDFGRTIGSNGDGTDHAWGGHHFVIGGAVKAGLYGTLPDLTLDGKDDASKKGRLIPSISSSQYLATIVKWYGADESTLDSLFPELKNFSQRDLGFMSA